MTSLDGPRLPPLSGTARSLVVLLHGYGADGDDLIDIGRAWQGYLPDTAFVAPHAPDPCGMAPMGRQWFPLTMRDPHERWTGVVGARPTLDGFLDAELARHGLDDTRMVLVGFSQGTMMALHAGLRRSRQPAAIVGYSGMLVGPERLADEGACAPPVLLVHGSADDVIPAQALFMSAQGLAAAGLTCEWHLSMDVGHGIDEDGLRHGLQFAAFQLTGRLPDLPTHSMEPGA
ncbi:dienelactone hydrolase family protein [uncultured Alsobacter sp.]|uniref:alpha/beta hydrolase n=1 Tax=uncultured Alsobacter sp. TaxID=1748258 RepID=UPI0025D848A8|nr:dienelactone hydrolase family protein [uncultured Alsobacter sp.]